MNADDWGQDPRTTDCIVDCFLRGTISSVSAMVFMQDSHRAAAIASDLHLDAGLHLNLTAPFTGARVSAALTRHQEAVSRFLTSFRFAQSVFHPGLLNSFEYSVAAQLDRFALHYGKQPSRIDGHHHMHLCANVVLGGLLPAGTIVRRNFSFPPGEKSLINRLYRRAIDKLLARQHPMTDMFFSLQSFLSTKGLQTLLPIVTASVIELAAHPANDDEHRFLTSEDLVASSIPVNISHGYRLSGTAYNRHEVPIPAAGTTCTLIRRMPHR